MRNSIKRCLSARTGAAFLAVALVLTGCEETGTPAEGDPTVPTQTGGTSVNRDVERPDVFSVSENALWDGRPSLGGVWVAYPANVDPERVIIRNLANGKSVLGALFRRERENPGPKIQLSSDAAAALGVIAGSPTEISIVVLRREEVVVEVPPPVVEAAEDVATEPEAPEAEAPVVVAPTPAPESAGAEIAAIVEQTLDDVPATDAAEEEAVASAPRQPLFPLAKPFIQVGTFEEEALATELVTALTDAGVTSEVQADDAENPTLWRVITGPFTSRSERNAQLRIIKGLGYTDAFTFN